MEDCLLLLLPQMGNVEFLRLTTKVEIFLLSLVRTMEPTVLVSTMESSTLFLSSFP